MRCLQEYWLLHNVYAMQVAPPLICKKADCVRPVQKNLVESKCWVLSLNNVQLELFNVEYPFSMYAYKHFLKIKHYVPPQFSRCTFT